MLFSEEPSSSLTRWELRQIHCTVSRSSVCFSVAELVAGTQDKVFVRFLVDGLWSADEVFFDGTEPEVVNSKWFPSASDATAMQLVANGSDAWCFWRIVVNGSTDPLLSTAFEAPRGRSSVDYCLRSGFVSRLTESCID